MPEISVPDSNYESLVLGFAKDAIQEGQQFVQAQKGYEKIALSIAAIMGDKAETFPTALSSTSLNHIGKTATDLCSFMTDIKPFWEYKTQNKRYEANCELYGKLSAHWYQQRQIDLKLASGIKLITAAGTFFAHQVWNETPQDIDMIPEDPRDVLPIRPGSIEFTLQDSFGVIVRRERTVNYLKRLYPSKAHLIKPDRDGSVSLSLANTRIGQLFASALSPFHERLFGSRPAANNLPRVPVCDLYTMYLDDQAEHKSVNPRYMGDWGLDDQGNPRALNNWSYKVEKGERLYPRKRLVIFTSTAILYDGPSIYWHGLFPLSKLTLDPWQWAPWFGKGLLWDCLPVQKALDKVERVIDDHVEKWAQPDVLADRNAVAKSSLDRVNSRRAGLKLRYNALAGKDSIAIRYPDPLPEYLVAGLPGFYIEQIRTLSGASDASQLMRLNQMPASDTVDKILETMSPSIRLRSRYIEAFMREFAMMLAYNFTQFYTIKRRFTIAGDEGVLPEDFDFDPGNMLPDYPHEEDVDDEGNPTALALARGPRPRYDRAQEVMKQYSFTIAKGSLLSASEMEKKLIFLQLRRSGEIDKWTFAEVFDIPNMGTPPEGANTIPQRLLAEQMMGIGLNAGPTGMAAGGGGGGSPGRKASGQEPPRLKVSESG